MFSGDIIVEHNVEAGRLIAGGNVMIKKGSCSRFDCFIEAKGEVSGSFFEAANINAEGNVTSFPFYSFTIATQLFFSLKIILPTFDGNIYLTVLISEE